MPARSESSTSLTLLQRASQADPVAWERLTNLYAPLVYSWRRRAGLNEHQAGDVVQEVFVSVHRSLKNFRKERPGDTFRGWLWTITRNKANDFFRKELQQAGGVGGTSANLSLAQIPEQEPREDEAETPLSENSFFLRGLELVKSEFEAKTWQAFWRFAVDGVPAGDVGEELGMSAGAVRKAKLRVLRRLQEELKGLLD